MSVWYQLSWYKRVQRSCCCGSAMQVCRQGDKSGEHTFYCSSPNFLLDASVNCYNLSKQEGSKVFVATLNGLFFGVWIPSAVKNPFRDCICDLSDLCSSIHQNTPEVADKKAEMHDSYRFHESLREGHLLLAAQRSGYVLNASTIDKEREAMQSHPGYHHILNVFYLRVDVPLVVTGAFQNNLAYYLADGSFDIRPGYENSNWIGLFRDIYHGARYIAEVGGLRHCDLRPENILLSSENLWVITNFANATTSPDLTAELVHFLQCLAMKARFFSRPDTYCTVWDLFKKSTEVKVAMVTQWVDILGLSLSLSSTNESLRGAVDCFFKENCGEDLYSTSIVKMEKVVIEVQKIRSTYQPRYLNVLCQMLYRPKGFQVKYLRINKQSVLLNNHRHVFLNSLMPEGSYKYSNYPFAVKMPAWLLDSVNSGFFTISDVRIKAEDEQNAIRQREQMVKECDLQRRLREPHLVVLRDGRIGYEVQREYECMKAHPGYHHVAEVFYLHDTLPIMVVSTFNCNLSDCLRSLDEYAICSTKFNLQLWRQLMGDVFCGMRYVTFVGGLHHRNLAPVNIVWWNEEKRWVISDFAGASSAGDHSLTLDLSHFLIALAKETRVLNGSSSTMLMDLYGNSKLHDLRKTHIQFFSTTTTVYAALHIDSLHAIFHLDEKFHSDNDGDIKNLQAAVDSFFNRLIDHDNIVSKVRCKIMSDMEANIREVRGLSSTGGAASAMR